MSKADAWSQQRLAVIHVKDDARTELGANEGSGYSQLPVVFTSNPILMAVKPMRIARVNIKNPLCFLLGGKVSANQPNAPNLVPMILWQYGLITLEQLDRIFDWLETA